MTFDRAGDAAIEGGEVGFSGSPELLKSASRLNAVLVNRSKKNMTSCLPKCICVGGILLFLLLRGRSRS